MSINEIVTIRPGESLRPGTNRSAGPGARSDESTTKAELSAAAVVARVGQGLSERQLLAAAAAGIIRCEVDAAGVVRFRESDVGVIREKFEQRDQAAMTFRPAALR